MEVLTQTRVVKSDGSSEERVQVQNPQEGGILQQYQLEYVHHNSCPVKKQLPLGSRYIEANKIVE